MEFWENEMKRKGYDLLLTSTQVNEEAQHFYRKLGFRAVGPEQEISGIRVTAMEKIF